MRFAKEPPSRLQIKRIAGHRIEADGNMSFLAHKEGEDVLSAEYLPARDFLEKNALLLTEYGRKNHLDDARGIFREDIL